MADYKTLRDFTDYGACCSLGLDDVTVSAGSLIFRIKDSLHLVINFDTSLARGALSYCKPLRKVILLLIPLPSFNLQSLKLLESKFL
jgi:hypothetical protein